MTKTFSAQHSTHLNITNLFHIKGIHLHYFIFRKKRDKINLLCSRQKLETPKMQIEKDRREEKTVYRCEKIPIKEKKKIINHLVIDYLITIKQIRDEQKKRAIEMHAKVAQLKALQKMHNLMLSFK